MSAAAAGALFVGAVWLACWGVSSAQASAPAPEVAVEDVPVSVGAPEASVEPDRSLADNADDGGSSQAVGPKDEVEVPCAAEAGATSAKLAVGPWFARFDGASLDRARQAAADALVAEAETAVGLVAGTLTAVAVICVAAGAACLIAAHDRRMRATIARPLPTGAMDRSRNHTVTKRKEA